MLREKAGEISHMLVFEFITLFVRDSCSSVDELFPKHTERSTTKNNFQLFTCFKYLMIMI